MKNNIPYYQHFSDSDQHPKFKMLRVKYGWKGEGKFWALNNRIAQADDCRIDFNKKYNVASIADDLDFKLEEFKEFIKYLHEECDLIIKENEFITTEIIQENLDRVMKKRKKNQSDYKKKIKETLRNIKVSENNIKPSEFIQSKVKVSKLNKIKLNIPYFNKLKLCIDEFEKHLETETLKEQHTMKLDQNLICCDELIRIDKLKPEDIILSIKKAFEHENGKFKWSDQFRSFTKLRKKSESLGCKYIEVFLGLKDNKSNPIGRVSHKGIDYDEEVK